VSVRALPWADCIVTISALVVRAESNTVLPSHPAAAVVDGGARPVETRRVGDERSAARQGRLRDFLGGLKQLNLLVLF